MNQIQEKQIQEVERRYAVYESMINSMTKGEREQPELLAKSPSRRWAARGLGVAGVGEGDGGDPVATAALRHVVRAAWLARGGLAGGQSEVAVGMLGVLVLASGKGSWEWAGGRGERRRWGDDARGGQTLMIARMQRCHVGWSPESARSTLGPPHHCRRRVAQGSGRSEEQVSELVAMFASMRAQVSTDANSRCTLQMHAAG